MEPDAEVRHDDETQLNGKVQQGIAERALAVSIPHESRWKFHSELRIDVEISLVRLLAGRSLNDDKPEAVMSNRKP